MGSTGSCSVCEGLCHASALVKEPDNWRALLAPGGLWKGPGAGSRYRVGAESDNWWTVASKDGWSDPWDLIDFNFKTRDPEEVNWYLYHFVGCRLSRDHKNLSFDKPRPGIIYTKKNHYAIDVPKVTPAVPVTPKPLFKRGLTWFGGGVQVGTMTVFEGVGTVRAYMVNLEDPNSRFWLDIDTKRTGAGGGASIAGVAVVITGLYDPHTVIEAPSGAMDFDLALAGRWGSLIKGLRVVPNMGVLYRAARTMQHAVRPGLVGECVTTAKLTLKAYGISEAANDLEVHVLEIPFAGYGLQGSIYWGENSYRAHHLRLTPDDWE